MPENLSSGFTNNKGAGWCRPACASAQTDQPLCYLESIMSKLAPGETSIFYQVSVAVETGLSLALSETRKTGYVASGPILKQSMKQTS